MKQLRSTGNGNPGSVTRKSGGGTGSRVKFDLLISGSQLWDQDGKNKSVSQALYIHGRNSVDQRKRAWQHVHKHVRVEGLQWRTSGICYFTCLNQGCHVADEGLSGSLLGKILERKTLYTCCHFFWPMEILDLASVWTLSWLMKKWWETVLALTSPFVERGRGE